MPAESVTRCSLCGGSVEVREHVPGVIYSYKCERCGKYRVTETLIATRVLKEPKFPLWALSAFTRQCTEEGRSPSATLDIENYEAIAAEYSRRSVGWQIDALLQLLRRRSAYLGGPADFVPERDYPLLRGRPEEAQKLVEYCKSAGFLERRQDALLILSVEAWRHLESASPRASGRCLVAMHFAPELLPVYQDGIGPAVGTDCGYTAIRVDLNEFNGKICDQILAEIKQSAFVVADFTGNRQNVYFEAGFALGLGLPVIFCVRAGSVEEAHFDTRQYNHIVWSDPADLRAKLKARIIATIGHRRPA